MISITQLRQDVQTTEFDTKLANLYVKPVEQIAPYRDRVLALVDHFTDYFAGQVGKQTSDHVGNFVEQTSDHAGSEREVVICSAAGRTEIGGNHTDHQRGKVLTGSVDMDALACASLNGTNKICMVSEGFGETTVDISSLEVVPEEENTTAALIRGIAAAIYSRGYQTAGFNVYVTSDVPGGSGLSSSACIEVLLGTVMNHLFAQDALSMVEIARIGQYAENVYFGKPCGLMDQMGCAVGGIITIDFADKEHPVYHHVDVDFSEAGYAVCIIDSGADHADLTGDYAAIPAECRAAAAVFGKEVLSEVDEAEFFKGLAKVRAQAGDRAVLRGVHYFGDCRKVEQQVEALEKKDFDRFMELIRASGQSSFCYLQNVSTFRDPADQPVAYAIAAAEHALRGRGAVRVHGGGFAGTVQAFVPLEEVDRFTQEVDDALRPGACRVMAIRPIGGCVLIG